MVSVLLSAVLLSCCYFISASEQRALETMQQRVWKSQVDMSTLLLAAGTPKCVQPCIQGLVRAGSASFKFNSTMQNIETVCSEYRNASMCVEKKGCDSSNIYTIVTKGMQAICVDRFAMLKMVAPCLEVHADTILRNCDVTCELGSALDAVSGDENVLKLAENGGNALVLLEHLGDVCNNLMCFLSCAQKGLNFRCPGTGLILVETAIRPLEFAASQFKGAAKSLMDAVRSHLPESCHPLIDLHYLARLKFFGALPERKPIKPTKPKKPSPKDV